MTITLHHDRQPIEGPRSGTWTALQLVEWQVAPLGALRVAETDISEGSSLGCVVLDEPPVATAREVVQMDDLVPHRRWLGGVELGDERHRGGIGVEVLSPLAALRLLTTRVAISTAAFVCV